MKIDKSTAQQARFFVFVSIFSFLALVTAAYFVSTPVSGPIGTSVDDNQSGVCNKDLKACPSGEFVSRNAQNNCEFDECKISGNVEPVISCCNQNDWYNCKTPEQEANGVTACEAGGCAACQKADNGDVSVSDTIDAAPVACAKGTATCADGAQVSRKINKGCAFARCADGSIPTIN